MKRTISFIIKLSHNRLDEEQARMVVIALCVLAILLSFVIGWGDEIESSEDIVFLPAIEEVSDYSATSTTSEQPNQ